MKLQPLVSGLVLLPRATSYELAPARLVRTFVADNTSYGIYAPGGSSAGAHILHALTTSCASMGHITAMAATTVPDKWLANDNDDMELQLWTSAVHGDTMQLCLRAALITIGFEDRLSSNFVLGYILGVFFAAGGWGAVTLYYYTAADASRVPSAQRGPWVERLHA